MLHKIKIYYIAKKQKLTKLSIKKIKLSLNFFFQNILNLLLRLPETILKFQFQQNKIFI